MAITGTGTQDDPFIVHNYDELKERLGKTDWVSDKTVAYCKLGNDIDCNDYGANWEWETIRYDFNYGKINWNLDLGGHTIKNAVIKSGKILFDNNNSNYVNNMNVYNGKILNIFSNNASNIISRCALKNVSMSVNATGVTDCIYNGCHFENCAIYIKTSKLNNYVFGNYNYDSLLKGCDIWIDCDNLNQKLLFPYGVTFAQNSRFRGYLKGIPAAHGNTAKIITSGKFNSCVVEIDMKNLTCSLPLYLTSDNVVGTVTNSDLLHENSKLTAFGTLCTTEQMRSAEYLNSVGFNVVDVSGSE